MRLFNFVLVLFVFLLIVACGNTEKKVSSGEAGLSAEPVEIATEATVDLSEYGIADYPQNVLGGLQVGEQAPSFNLNDQDGNEQSLDVALEKGPVLLVFLRADWCPYCVRHLKEFQDHIQELHVAGVATVIAISPQESSYMKAFQTENQLSYPILFDIDHVAMKDYKVFFRVTEKYNNRIKEAKGNRVEFYNGDTNAYLPVPATYLIGQDKTIKYVHYDPNYKKRSDLTEVLAQLVD